MKIKNLVSLGRMAIFYVPVSKLELPVLWDSLYLTPREVFHHVLMERYNAYTLEISDTRRGFWREHHEGEIYTDENARYEVSFDGKDLVPPFVEFLSRMCYLIGEKAIYLTMGEESWLVLPEENNEVPNEAS